MILYSEFQDGNNRRVLKITVTVDGQGMLRDFLLKKSIGQIFSVKKLFQTIDI